jgi:hypothetical protein
MVLATVISRSDAVTKSNEYGFSSDDPLLSAVSTVGLV